MPDAEDLYEVLAEVEVLVEARRPGGSNYSLLVARPLSTPPEVMISSAGPCWRDGAFHIEDCAVYGGAQSVYASWVQCREKSTPVLQLQRRGFVFRDPA